jgi:hypothetical protein
VSLAASTHELADLGRTQEHLSAATEIAVGHPARKNRTRRQTARRRGSA